MTTRPISRCSVPSRMFARVGAAPALMLAISAGAALGQPAPVKPPSQPLSQPHSTTAGAASSMVADRASQEQAKKKVGKDDETAGGDVKVDANQIVDLHVKDEDLTRVLELLAIQSQRNIIPTKSVNSRVSANLYGVTFYEALDALLHPNGFGWMERSNRIEVYTLEELKQIEAASRVRIAKVIKLNYLNAVDAGAFVEALLSEGGQIKTNGKTSTFAIPEKTPVGQDDFANDAMLVIYDFEENVAEIERLVKEIDTRPSQVLVEATILQTQLNEANAFGVDFAVLGDLNFTDFSGSGGALSAVNSLISGKAKSLGAGDIEIPGADGEGRALVSSPGNTAGPGTLKIGLVDNDVAIFIKMLDEVGDTTIISNPKVLALNRQPARVLVGRKVGYLSTTSTDTTTTQSVEFLDTGTQLYFRPFVTNEGMIRLELKPAVSEAVIRDTRDATGAAVTIPDEITNEIVTNVLVRDGQTVVLGGLFRESTQSSRRQVPFLGDIPILGAAFRGHDDETSRNEIIFMVKPSIVSDQVLVMQGERGSDLVDRVRAGSRESLLLWSRERMSGQNLVEAQRLANEGKDAEALWKVEQSLSMNHNQPEAILLREKLSNKKASWPGRSMLDHIVNNEASIKPQPGGPGAALDPTRTGGRVNIEAVPAAQAAEAPAALTTQSEVNSTATPNLGGQSTSGAPGAEPQSTDQAPESTGEAVPADQGEPVQPASDAATSGGEITGEQSAATATGEGVTGEPVETVTTLSGESPSEVPSVETTTTPAEGDAPAVEGTETSGETVITAGDAPIETSVEATTTTVFTTAPDAQKAIVAWAWFYTGFREFFIPTQYVTASATHDQANQQATIPVEPTEPVSNVPTGDQ